ncbi:MAG TPA: Flp pilus assembly protein CpaB [Gaiellaceae bacterium]|jgi:Flp pilus assembly protein CpaB|nr:Flp pilus assembly protein CpaB [Gaiellaceae bacterium]
MSYRLRNIGIAVALAVLAALLTIFYVTNYKRSVQSGEELVPVYVAAGTIPVGTSGSEVTDRNLLKPVEVVRRTVVPGAISAPDQISQLVATEKVYEGEQVTLSRFKPLGEQGVFAQLRGRLRAVQVPGNEHQLLMGTVRTGDHVDFVGSLEADTRQRGPATRVVLRDIVVLKAPADATVESRLSARPDEAYSALVAVTDSQAQKLFHVVTHGDWTLQLRPVADPADSRDTVDTDATVMRGRGVRRGR